MLSVVAGPSKIRGIDLHTVVVLFGCVRYDLGIDIERFGIPLAPKPRSHMRRLLSCAALSRRVCIEM